jgi:GNAT superfamily N-acetyltransferase
MNEQVTEQSVESPVILNGIHVRPATEDDRAEIIGMLGVQFAGFTVDAAMHPMPGVESAIEYYDRVILPGMTKGVVLVAVPESDPDEVLGWCHWLKAVSPTQTLYRAVRGSTFVKPEYRRRGVATALRKEASQLCLSEGFEVMVADLEVGNKDQLSALPGENPMVVTVAVQIRLSEIL